MRAHLEHAAKRGNAQAIADLADLPLPPFCRPVFDLYLSLQQWRGSGGMGASPLTTQDLLGFCQLYGVTISPWYVACVKRLDLLQLTIQQEAL